MKIPTSQPTLNSYLDDLTTLLADPKTHLYIDASFLVWSLRLGSQSIKEITGFLLQTLPDRIHVPLWAAHEFQHHLVAKSSINQANLAATELENVCERLFSELAPALSEAGNLPEQSPTELRLATQDAMLQLSVTGQVLKNWMKNSEQSTREALVNFVNQHSLKSKYVFDYFEGLEALTDIRYNSRIPPGFQDRIKKQRALEGGKDKEQLPHNFAGDFIFWKEILDHARDNNGWISQKVERILILTEDGKNDWVVGGATQTQPTDGAFSDVNPKWSILPVPHPMLSFEAAAYSKVKDVFLVNRTLLGAHLHKLTGFPTFVNAAFNTKLPDFRAKKNSKPKNGKTKIEAPGTSLENDATEQIKSAVVVLPDANAVDEIRKAITKTELPTPKALASLFKVSENEIAEEIYKIETNLEKLDESAFPQAVEYGRVAINSAQAGDALMQNALQGILKKASLLPDQAPASLNYFFAGVLFGKYFTPDGSVITRPSTVLLEQIAACEASAFAIDGISALGRVLEAVEVKPIYFPKILLSKLQVTIQTSSPTPKSKHLRSIVVDGTDVFDQVSDGENLISSILKFDHERESQPITTKQVIRALSSFYGIPYSRLEYRQSEQSINLKATDGFVEHWERGNIDD